MSERSLDPDTGSLDERKADFAAVSLEEVTGWAEELRGTLQVGGFEVTPPSGFHVSSRWPGYSGSLRNEHRRFLVPGWHEETVLSTVVVEIHECTSHACEHWTGENPPEFSRADLPQGPPLEFTPSR